ncbi:hypothetical protein C8R47DRAFT_1145473 [Mycena vitilis]|nr:hypothetical protein C8R47DRAFT_1145473 [Mycena vitilis]
MWMDILLPFLRHFMARNTTPSAGGLPSQDGSFALPADTEDIWNEHVDRFLGNVGDDDSVRATQASNIGEGGQQFSAHRRSKDSLLVPGGNIHSLRPNSPRQLPPTPTSKASPGRAEKPKTVAAGRVQTSPGSSSATAKWDFCRSDFWREDAEIQPQREQNFQRDVCVEESRAGIQDPAPSNAEPKLVLLAADSISGAEAVSIAKLLNANIFQTATFIADALECAPAKSSTAMQAYFGESIAKAVQSADPGVVQIALQTAVARRCKVIVDSWCLGDERFGNSLCALYEKIILAENPITAHRWRAMTRAQTRCKEDDRLVTSALVQCIFEVMVAAGWILQEYTSNGRKYIEDRFPGQIAAIAKYSLQLRKAIGEDIVSEDLEIVYVGPNQIFQEQTMEDVYAVGRRKDQSPRAIEVVACTSEVGLQKRGGSTLNVEVGRDILLRPKVVLQSAFV